MFHVDAGWNSNLASNNIERIVDGLGLDLYTEVIDWQEMQDLQLAFFKSGVPHIDAPQDHAFFATMYKFAAKYNIKSILTGGNLSTECVRNPVDWMYYQSDSSQLKDISSKYGNIKLRKFPITSILWHKIYLPYVKGIKIYRLLDYIEYTKEEAKKTLINEFDWQPYPQKHFESRFTRFYESYWLPVRFGYDVRKVQYSSLILTNQMTRDDAIMELKKAPFDSETLASDIEYVSSKLNISIEELNYYLTIPKRTYTDYKNQSYIYRFGSFVSKLLRLEIGGKR